MRIAVFTIVRNESVFLPIWLKYYRQYFKASDMYVLDNDSTDNSTKGIIAHTIPVSSATSFDAAFLRETVSNFQHELLMGYDYVLFAEVDEIVHPLGYNSFRDMIDTTGCADSYRCDGYEIIHKREVEDPIDFERPLMRQRNYWYRSSMFSKTLLSRVPSVWSLGFHTCNKKVSVNERLLLIHLHRLDFNFCLERNRLRCNAALNPVSVAKDQGWQNFIDDVEKMDDYFKKFHGPVGGLVHIPESYKDII